MTVGKRAFVGLLLANVILVGVGITVVGIRSSGSSPKGATTASDSTPRRSSTSSPATVAPDATYLRLMKSEIPNFTPFMRTFLRCGATGGSDDCLINGAIASGVAHSVSRDLQRVEANQVPGGGLPSPRLASLVTSSISTGNAMYAAYGLYNSDHTAAHLHAEQAEDRRLLGLFNTWRTVERGSGRA